MKNSIKKLFVVSCVGISFFATSPVVVEAFSIGDIISVVQGNKNKPKKETHKKQNTKVEQKKEFYKTYQDTYNYDHIMGREIKFSITVTNYPEYNNFEDGIYETRVGVSYKRWGDAHYVYDVKYKSDGKNWYVWEQAQSTREVTDWHIIGSPEVTENTILQKPFEQDVLDYLYAYYNSENK